MRFMRRLLGFLWTFTAAVPVVAHGGDQAESSRPGAAAAGSTRSDSRATLGQARIGLGETVLRDLRTPFVAPPSFHLDLTTRVVVTDSWTVRPSDSQTVRRSNQARAPPTPH